jgi:acetyl esterase/lipase
MQKTPILAGASMLALGLLAMPALSQDAPQLAPAVDQATAESPDSGTMERATPEMAEVLAKLQELGVRPVHEFSVEEARTQPTPRDAVTAVLEDRGESTEPEAVAAVEDITIPGPAGDIPARVYTPEGDGPFPVVLYFHGGGFVIADLDTYDATPRALANQADAIVISSHYRQGPENKFPAFGEDALAAYVWTVENAGSLNGDTTRVAVAGESAGGNLAINVAIAARDQELQAPVGQLLVYPLVGTDLDNASYVENQNAMPLGRADIEWFVANALNPDDLMDPRVDVLGRADVAGLPRTAIVNAEIDPLRTEGEELAGKLENAGVEVAQMTYPGVTHEFFGMAAAVPTAQEAQDFAGTELRAMFEESATGAVQQ